MIFFITTSSSKQIWQRINLSHFRHLSSLPCALPSSGPRVPAEFPLQKQSLRTAKCCVWWEHRKVSIAATFYSRTGPFLCHGIERSLNTELAEHSKHTIFILDASWSLTCVSSLRVLPASCATQAQGNAGIFSNLPIRFWFIWGPSILRGQYHANQSYEKYAPILFWA